MEFNIQKEGDIGIVEMDGSLLAEVQTREFLEHFSEAVQNGTSRFIIDLGQTKFINSSGLGMLLTCLTKARKAGGDVVLADISEQLSNLLVMTKLNSIFTVAGSVDEAIKVFNEK